MMLGVTTHLATDVGSFPLLWVVPLAIYLASFVVVFRRTPEVPSPRVVAPPVPNVAAPAARPDAAAPASPPAPTGVQAPATNGRTHEPPPGRGRRRGGK